MLLEGHHPAQRFQHLSSKLLEWRGLSQTPDDIYYSFPEFLYSHNDGSVRQNSRPNIRLERDAWSVD